MLKNVTFGVRAFYIFSTNGDFWDMKRINPHFKRLGVPGALAA